MNAHTAVLSTNLKIREGHNMLRQDTAHSPAPVSTPEISSNCPHVGKPHMTARHPVHMPAYLSFRSEITRTTPRSTTLASAIIPVLQPRHSPPPAAKSCPLLTFSPGQISELQADLRIVPIRDHARCWSCFFRWVIGSACLMNLSLRGRSSIGFRRRERLGRLPLPGPGLSPFG